MREIKFKVWNLLTKHWINDGQPIQCLNTLTNTFSDGTLLFLQYTGFKDASGTEIYEGDIVDGHFEDAGDYFNPPEYQGCRYIVEWNEDYGRFDFKDIWSGETDGADDSGEFDKVVGNICQNPDPEAISQS